MRVRERTAQLALSEAKEALERARFEQAQDKAKASTNTLLGGLAGAALTFVGSAGIYSVFLLSDARVKRSPTTLPDTLVSAAPPLQGVFATACLGLGLLKLITSSRGCHQLVAAT